MATGGDKPPSLDADVDMAVLASLDAPAASSAASPAGAPSTRFRPKAKRKPKPVPMAVPISEPVPEPESAAEPEPEAATAAPLEDDRLDATGVDGAGDGAGVGERAEAAEEEEDFVVREIDVYYTPKPFDDDTKVMSSGAPSLLFSPHSLGSRPLDEYDVSGSDGLCNCRVERACCTDTP
jgi:DNA-directed RNA polymerase-3 subunit RPC5